MRKSYLSLIIIFLAYFFTTNIACCEEDFFANSKFENAKADKNISTDKIKKSIGVKKEKFSFFKRKNKEQEEKKGYYGSLPDINKELQYKKQQSSKTSSQTDLKMPQDEKLNEENLKPAPFDDSLFLDMVIKKEKNSEYINDIQKIKFALNNLKKCLEENGNIQRFNGCVNVLELYVQNLKKKYDNKNESYKESYIELLNTNYYAKLLGNLKYDANYYARYVPVNEGQYSENNILSKEEDLLNRINRTLFLLNNET